MRHILGVMLLQEWLLRWRGSYDEARISGQAILLGQGASSRFAIALPTRRGVRPAPALVVQEEEEPWLARIAWKRACVRPGELCLLASRMEQDDSLGLPCLPAFAVVLALGPHTGSLGLSSFHALDVRQVAHDRQAGTWEVCAGRPLLAMPLAAWEESTPAEGLLSQAEVRPGTSMEDVLKRRLAQTEATRNPWLTTHGAGGTSSGR